MADQPSEIYSCQCQGCPNGFGSSFSAAPESWWAEKGMTPPKNCPDCRAWVKEQADEALRCQGCGSVIRVPARYKISHHKRIGQYVNPRECRECERGERPTKGVAPRPDLDRAAQREAQISELPKIHNCASYLLDTNPENYQHPVHDAPSRQEHIERHTAWSPFSEVSEGKSATALGETAADFRSLLRSVGIIAQSENADRIREYRTITGRIVKVFLTDSARIEISIIEPTAGPGGHELVTTYDGFTVEKVLGKLKKGEKQSAGEDPKRDGWV
ncbi:hypothetical protein [Kribbella sp. NPDC051620]|uniref:hypothetical protein n=1 Tax=Kribbella sp. NPDC051620 TaxID=3364120 RepID=UPI00378C6C3D